MAASPIVADRDSVSGLITTLEVLELTTMMSGAPGHLPSSRTAQNIHVSGHGAGP
jgi:hypothetical protein